MAITFQYMVLKKELLSYPGRSIMVAVALIVMGIHSNGLAQKHEALVSVTQALRTALLERNGEQLNKLTMPELSYGHSSNKIETQSQFIESVVQGPTYFSKIEITELTSSIVGDVGIVRHRLDGILVEQSTEREVKLGVLLIWKRSKGEWKLLARQAYKL